MGGTVVGRNNCLDNPGGVVNNLKSAPRCVVLMELPNETKSRRKGASVAQFSRKSRQTTHAKADDSIGRINGQEAGSVRLRRVTVIVRSDK